MTIAVTVRVDWCQSMSFLPSDIGLRVIYMHEKRTPDPSIFVEPAETAVHDEVRKKNTEQSVRYGLWLFGLYVVLYGGFIALATFRHDLLARTPLGGINVAILYGFGLIVAALLLALLYLFLCRHRPKPGER